MSLQLPVSWNNSGACNNTCFVVPTSLTSRMAMAWEVTEMRILESLRGSGNRTFPNHGQTKEKTPTLGLLTKARLTKLRGRFPDKFGRDHELMWTTVQDINTGQEHQALFNLKFWPDPHYLELALDCHVAVEPDSNFCEAKVGSASRMS